ncbi:MAG: cytochrome c biogenesis CcdA family protein [Actinomycetota bacterium]
MTGFPERVDLLLSAGSAAALPVVAAVGFFSTLRNPCAVPLYPAATSVCVDPNSAERQRASFLNASAFVLGMAISIAILGLGAAAAGRVIGIGRWGRYLIACLPLLMGLQRLNWLHIPSFGFGFKKTFRPGFVGAFATGLLLSLVVGRCGGTVLGTILAYAAYHREFLYGGVLLFAYGLGAGIPLITFGSVVGKATAWVDRKGYRKWTESLMGAAMLLLGFYMLWLA